MFFENVGYKWGEYTGTADGAVFRASAQSIEDATRREKPAIKGTTLFDPQLYFLDLDLNPDEHGDCLTRLASYPWFGMKVPKYESETENRAEWKEGIRGKIASHWQKRTPPSKRWAQTVTEAVGFQVQFGADAIILPATLISDPESQLDDDLARLDEAIEIAKGITKKLPLYASLPIEDGLVRHRAAAENEVVSALADAFSAREEIKGAYLLVAQSTAQRERITNPHVAGAIVRLSQLLGGEGGLNVIVNFVEALGLPCLAAGAKAYASSYSRKGRRLAATDYRETGGGSQLPKFFSSSLLLDFYPERDLERMRERKLLRYVKDDRTPASADLLDALSAGKKSRDVVAWEESKNNVAAAQSHYVHAHAKAARKKRSLDDILTELQEAEARWIYLADQFKSDPLQATDGSHLSPWRKAVEDLIAEHT